MKFFFVRNVSLKYPVIIFFCLLSLACYSQPAKGFLTGKVVDGTTYKILFGVTVSLSDSSYQASTAADGHYTIKINQGAHVISYRLPGFQAKIISQVNIIKGQVTYMDIILYPLIQSLPGRFKNRYNDSLPVEDSVLKNIFF